MSQHRVGFAKKKDEFDKEKEGKKNRSLILDSNHLKKIMED